MQSREIKLGNGNWLFESSVNLLAASLYLKNFIPKKYFSNVGMTSETLESVIDENLKKRVDFVNSSIPEEIKGTSYEESFLHEQNLYHCLSTLHSVVSTLKTNFSGLPKHLREILNKIGDIEIERRNQ
jgi:hypothetical protein